MLALPLLAALAASVPGPELAAARVLVRESAGISCALAPPAARARGGSPAPVHVLERRRESLAASAGLQIVLRGTDQLEAHPEARDAFLRAATRWESLVSSPVTIVIDADYGTTAFGSPFPAPGVLGTTLSKGVSNDWVTVRDALLAHAGAKSALYAQLPATRVPTDLGPVTGIATSAAVFRALGLMPAVEDPAAEQARFGNPSRIAFQESSDWVFDPSGGIPPDGFDFDAVVVHEIGHVLGFDSWVGYHEADPQAPLVLALLDLFRFRPSATPPSLATSPRVLSKGGEQVFFLRGPALALSTWFGFDPSGDFGAPHWKSEIHTGRLIGVMDPLLQPGMRQVVTTRDLAVLDAIGWQVAGSARLEPSARTVPIVLDAAGVGGVRFSTELTLANRSMAPADVTLEYAPADVLGASGAGTATASLPAGAQLIVPDALAFLRDHGLAIPSAGNQGGTLRVTFRGDASPDSYYALARTTSAAGSGRAGLAYPAIRQLDGLTGRSYIYGLRENASDRSNLALFGMGSAPVTLRVTLRSASGGQSIVLPEVTLGPGQWTQISRALAGTGFGAGWATVDLVAGTGPYGAYGVFNDNATNDGSYVAAVADPLAAEPQVVPVVVETSRFASELVLVNPAAAAVTASLAYVESLTPGAGAGGTATLPLAPLEQRILPSAVDWLRTQGVAVGAKGVASYAGTVTVRFDAGGTPSPGLSGARTAAPGGGGEYGLFTPAVAWSQADRWDTWAFGLRQDAASRSNLAVVNVGDASASLTLHVDVYDASSGTVAGSTPSFTLPPGGWTQFDGILASFGVAAGYARVVYEEGTGAFIAYGVVNDGASPSSGGTNDGSYFAASKR